MATEFVPTEQSDIDFANNLDGKTLIVSIKLPSGTTLPTLDSGCLWKIESGKFLMVKGSIQDMMR